MSFGFDHRLILAGQPFDSAGPARTFGQMAQLGQQQQAFAQQQAQEQRQLADMARKQERETGFRQLLQGAGADPRARLQALQSDPRYFAEAMEYEQHVAGLGTKQAQAQKAEMEWAMERGKLMAKPLAAGIPKNQAELDRYKSTLKRIGFNDWEMTGLERFDPEQTPHLLEQIRALDMPADAGLRREENEKDRSFKRQESEKDRAAARERATIIAGQKAAEAAGGRILAPTALDDLAKFDVAQEQLDGLFDEFERLNGAGFGSKLNRMATEGLDLQDTDAARFDAAAGAVRQGVGTILEGGKLAAGDELKYKKLLPRFGDAKEVTDAKRKGMKEFLKSLKDKREAALREGGYKVPGKDAAKAPKPTGGTVTVRRKVDGKTKTLSADAAAKYLKDPAFEVVR